MTILKTRDDYHVALERARSLIALDPEPRSATGEELSLLTTLIRAYESRVFPESLPGPIEAIRFRMEQQGLTQRDLIPFLGSRGRTSEVLAGKRPLTLPMIRALHDGLGIPTEVLIQETQPEEHRSESALDRSTLKELLGRTWVRLEAGIVSEVGAEETLVDWVRDILDQPAVPFAARRTRTVRASRTIDERALVLWTALVAHKAQRQTLSEEYEAGTISMSFLRDVAQLSRTPEGPALVAEFLRAHGIRFVVEPPLPRIRLDGAAIHAEPNPIVALTLRHDRIDNFWFTLLHELAHLAEFDRGGPDAFYDDLDIGDQGNPFEKRADSVAGEALIPREAWETSAVSLVRTPQAVNELARQLRVSPAVVAGRVRKESNNYRILNQMVGNGDVRRQFDEADWN